MTKTLYNLFKIVRLFCVKKFVESCARTKTKHNLEKKNTNSI